MRETVELVMDLLRSLDPSLDIRLDESETLCSIQLPPAGRADYRFVLYFYKDGEPQVAAIVVDGDPDAYSSSFFR